MTTGVVYEKKASAHGGTVTVVERSEGGLVKVDKLWREECERNGWRYESVTVRVGVS
jgi:hypothetical protein